MRRASPGLSSTSPTASWPRMVLPRRQPGDRQPEILYGAHGIKELGQPQRFCDVTVGMKRVTLHDVLLGLRRRQDDDRNHPQILILLDFTKDLAPVFPGHVEVEK